MGFGSRAPLGETARRLLAVAFLLSLLADRAFALDYAVTLAPIEDPVLDAALRASSTLIELAEKPPDSEFGLRRRAQEDLARLEKALRSSGYYDGAVTIEIAGQSVQTTDSFEPAAEPTDTEENAGAARQKVPVEIIVVPDKLYRLGTVTLGGGGDLRPPLLPALQPGAPARAADILAERDRLLNATLASGHPFATVTLEPAVVDHAAREVSVRYTVEAGPRAKIGDITVTGTEDVEPDFIIAHVGYFRGRDYTPSDIAAMREELRALDVFESVKVTPATELDESGRLPIGIEVVERDRRFIGFGANYSTNDGAGFTAYWGHRNLFGGAERLRLDADISGIGENPWSELNYSLGAAFTKPSFLTPRQTLLATLGLAQEYDSETFDKKAATASLGLERRLTDILSVSYGVEAEISRITEDGESRNFELFGPTGGIELDTTDDLLNPTQGIRASFNATAFPEFLGSSQDVYQTRATGSAYGDLTGDGTLVLAGRLSLASVFGGPIDDLPQDRLLYGGGGGSVRGYEFRSIGPEDEDGDPTGGRSLVEASIELRYRFLDDYGIVPFFDAGSVDEETFPSFREGVQYAAGLGFRYYSPIGPIRADVAVPLNPRDDDDPVAFYISIGQAF